MRLGELGRLQWVVFLVTLAGCGGGGGDGGTTTTTTTPPPAQPAVVVAAIGANDTRIAWAAQDGPLNYYRSSAVDCNIASVGLCPDGAMQSVPSVAQLPVVDAFIKQGTPGYVQLESAAHKTRFRLSTQRVPPRFWHDAVVFKGRLFVVGGAGDITTFHSDVWSSVDGVNWNLETADGGFSPRTGHRLAALNGKLHLVGGSDGFPPNPTKSDVWSSTDGVNWIEETSSADFGPRTEHEVVVLNNRLYLIGGDDGTGTPRNDVWSSPDGVAWTQETPDAGFPGRHLHQAVVLGNTMYVIGGRAPLPFLERNDVWSSTNGVNWTLRKQNAEFAARYSHQVVELGGRLYLIGGRTIGGGSAGPHVRFADVWSSADGVTWTEATPDVPFELGEAHAAAAFNGSMYVIGGRERDGMENVGDVVWSSANGSVWTEERSSAAFASRSGHQIANLNGTLYLVGGHNFDAGLLNDVWSSTDGLLWTQLTAAAPFARRMNHQLVAFNDQLYVIAGLDSSSTRLNDVWSSPDGVTWSQVTSGSGAAFSARELAQVAVLGGSMYLVGGSEAGGVLNDVWVSSNGADWNQVPAAGRFTPRIFHQVVALGSSLVLVGGIDSGGARNDVWRSFDNGVNWTEVMPTPAFPARAEHQLAVSGGTIYLAGGVAGTGGELNDVWSSPDGAGWTLQPGAAFSARAGHELVARNGVLYLIGGTTSGPLQLNDVWTSTDGTDWRELWRLSRLHWTAK